MNKANEVEEMAKRMARVASNTKNNDVKKAAKEASYYYSDLSKKNEK